MEVFATFRENSSVVTVDVLLLQGFQAAAAQQLGNPPDDTEPDMTALRRAAMIIYDQYLSDKVGISCSCHVLVTCVCDFHLNRNRQL